MSAYHPKGGLPWELGLQDQGTEGLLLGVRAPGPESSHGVCSPVVKYMGYGIKLPEFEPWPLMVTRPHFSSAV